MSHPILDYWRQAFAAYQVGPDHYSSDEMPDPILSPRFLAAPDTKQITEVTHFNLIHPYDAEPPALEGFSLRNNFALCRVKIVHKEIDFQISVQPLHIAARSETHLSLLQDGFPQDFEFLKRLEVFLPKLGAQYYVATIHHDGQPLASLTMGVAGSTAVLISGMVHSQFRGQKISRKLMALVHHLGTQMNVCEVFYWTKSERLLPYADQVDRYLIYVRDAKI